MSVKKPKGGAAAAAKGKSSGKGMLLSESSPFHIREAFKTIRTNLLFTLATKSSKAIVISSAMPSEGKSTTAANLAIVLAQTGAQVLLMDCDLRKPSLHRVFHLPADKGITSILCGIDKVEQALHQNVVPHLDLIIAGPMSPNPSELLGSAQMFELLAIVEKAYDYVIIDASPINIVSDAIIVSKQTAGIMLVTRQGQSRHDQLRKAVESCEFAGVNILGMVINESREANTSYYGYRYNEYAEGQRSK